MVLYLILKVVILLIFLSIKVKYIGDLKGNTSIKLVSVNTGYKNIIRDFNKARSIV